MVGPYALAWTGVIVILLGIVWESLRLRKQRPKDKKPEHFLDGYHAEIEKQYQEMEEDKAFMAFVHKNDDKVHWVIDQVRQCYSPDRTGTQCMWLSMYDQWKRDMNR